jgi:hypothetical protein
MPVLVTQALTMVGGVLASMVGKLLTASLIENLVLLGVRELVKKTASPVDDEVYANVHKAIKGTEPPKQ